HAAGVLDDGVLRKLTWDRFRTVLAPKALGAWNLHILTRDLPLHLFVLYSSGASMVGSPGQANHAAANAFLDALAHYRAALGLPALSINWGPWARLGAAARRRVAKRMRTRGVDEIPPRQGIDALEQLILHPAPRVGVLPIQWPRFLEQTAPTPFFEDFQQPDVTPEARPPEFLPRFTAAPPGERLSLLRDHIRHQAADVLGVDDPTSLDAGRGFLELGMDSLTSVELRNRLQVSLSRPLPATLVFDHPTMDKLARRLHEELTVTSPPPGVSPPPPVETSPPPLTDLDHLSEEELGALLDQATAQAFE
ncbi:MAG: KR domain-containing protein, partial [Desulfobacterales bacterium]|nr:KR domain-containing protein [Desulfobacterales bacterium]